MCISLSVWILEVTTSGSVGNIGYMIGSHLISNAQVLCNATYTPARILFEQHDPLTFDSV